MRRTTLSLLILPFALAACGTVSTPAPSAPPSSVSTSSAPVVRRSAIIEIKDDGYAPKEVNVSVGGTVTFINRGTVDRQPMSDPHPEHTGLAGFASPVISGGSTYSYTFSKAGTFGFHDELDPTITGTIIVE